MKQDDASANEPTHHIGARQSTQLAAIAAFVVLNLTIPFTLGDFFPFTTGSLFVDKPEAYCQYKVHTLSKNALLLFDSSRDHGPKFITPEGHRDYGLQRVYNGLPVRSGVGIVPPATVNVFGKIASEADVRRAVEANLIRQDKEGVRVVQTVYGPTDDHHVGIIETNQWIVKIPEPKQNDVR